MREKAGWCRKKLRTGGSVLVLWEEGVKPAELAGDFDVVLAPIMGLAGLGLEVSLEGHVRREGKLLLSVLEGADRVGTQAGAAQFVQDELVRLAARAALREPSERVLRPDGERPRSPVLVAVDAAVRCARCGAPGVDACDCWVKCPCGWRYARGERCANPSHPPPRRARRRR